MQSLVMSDIYMTPYLGQDQAVSGTLAYGIGCGRVILTRVSNISVTRSRSMNGQVHIRSSLVLKRVVDILAPHLCATRMQ